MMGADITFSDGTYFRDSYNLWNLAWVTGKSYWGCKGDKMKFMRDISKTTDKQIAKYVKKLVTEGKIRTSTQMDGEAFEYESYFKEHRDVLAAIFKKNPKVKVNEWSV